MIRSIRRVALGAAVAGAAIGALPALASASPCTYDAVHKVASVVDSSGTAKQLRVGVSGNLIFTQDGGNAPLNCVGGGTVATTTNTDKVNVFAQASGASDGVVLDQARGAFAPGATPEADGNSEIELALNGQSGHLSVFGTPGADVMRVSGPGRSPALSFLDFGPDDDDDVTYAASDVSLVGGDGADFLSGKGYGFFRDATTLPMGFSGGAGDDVIEGGLAVDHFAGNAGNDTLRTNDGNPELVSGGPGVDTAVRDGADTLFDVESPVFGSAGIGRVKLASKHVNARTGETTKLGVSWTHPKSWRALKMINLKAFDGATALGNVYVRMSDQRITGRGALSLVSSSLTRHDRTASAKLAVRLPRALAGKTLRLEVEAADRDDHLQVVSDAGSIRVAK